MTILTRVMRAYKSRHNEGVDPESRLAQIEFRMGEHLAKSVAPLLMPRPVYNRLVKEGNLVLVTPPIHPHAAERAGDPASLAVRGRLPDEWKRKDARFVIQDVKQGKHSHNVRKDLYNGLAWLFELEKDNSLVLGKVVRHAERPVRPQPLMLGVALRRYSDAKSKYRGSNWYDETIMWNQEITDTMHHIARKKIQELGDDAYIVGNPYVIDK